MLHRGTRTHWRLQVGRKRKAWSKQVLIYMWHARPIATYVVSLTCLASLQLRRHEPACAAPPPRAPIQYRRGLLFQIICKLLWQSSQNSSAPSSSCLLQVLSQPAAHKINNFEKRVWSSNQKSQLVRSNLSWKFWGIHANDTRAEYLPPAAYMRARETAH